MDEGSLIKKPEAEHGCSQPPVQESVVPNWESPVGRRLALEQEAPRPPAGWEIWAQQYRCLAGKHFQRCYCGAAGRQAS